MNSRVIFNADDFGISLGVNSAIERAHTDGVLNSASLMVNQKYAAEAVGIARRHPALEVGLHINLTNERPASAPSRIPLLVGRDGRFRNGFLGLLLLSIFRKRRFLAQVGEEIEAQIARYRAFGLPISHVDGHRHVHMIPAVFGVVRRMMDKYAIPRVRVMNENALCTIRDNRSVAYLFDGGIVKYALLRFFCWLNRYRSGVYFYTMLFTCKLSKEHFASVGVPAGYDAVEVMIHPSDIDLDAGHMDDIFDPSVVSHWRTAELETLLDRSVLGGFHFETGYVGPYRRIEQLWFSMNEQLRFLLVGGFNTVFAYGVYALLLRVVGLPYVWSLCVQYFISINVSVLTMRYYVFHRMSDFWRQFVRGWAVYLAMLPVNIFGLDWLVRYCHIDALPAQAVYVVVMTVATYFIHKFFSFRRWR